MRIKHIVFASVILVSVAAFAQKEELKKLRKIYDKDIPSASDFSDYKATLEKLKPLAVEENDKIYYDYYRVNEPSIEIASLGPNVTPMQLAKFLQPKAIIEMADVYNTTLNYEKKVGKKVFTDDINEEIIALRPMLINGAESLSKVQKFKEASDVLYAIYKMNNKDLDMLFYAASYSVNANDYDKALDYYYELKKQNYSGEGTLYYAKNITTKEDENFPTKVIRDIAITAKTHTNPREEKIPSKRGEIYKNIALILIQKDKTDEAKKAIADARKENPDDTSLIISEADLYLKSKDYTSYTNLVNEALAKNPNNADLVYNLGVISSEGGKSDEAENYYKKVINIDPTYFNAYLNLAELRLRGDEKFVTEMNKLGTSDKDNKRYEVLKTERNNNFKSMLPYLEKAVELKPDNEAAKKTLLSVYNALEMSDQYKALKAKM
jgi:tetratricopeptide (TPR) repeat protein